MVESVGKGGTVLDFEERIERRIEESKKGKKGEVVYCYFANVSRCLKRYEARVERTSPRPAWNSFLRRLVGVIIANDDTRRNALNRPIRTIRTSPGQKIAARSSNNSFLVFVELLGAIMMVAGHTIFEVLETQPAEIDRLHEKSYDVQSL